MVDRYRWINKSGRTRAQETYLSLGRVTVSRIAPCVASHHISGPLSHQPCFHSQLSIGTTKKILSRNVLLDFNWNLSGSSYCIQGWRLPSEIWWWGLCNKEQRVDAGILFNCKHLRSWVSHSRPTGQWPQLQKSSNGTFVIFIWYKMSKNVIMQ